MASSLPLHNSAHCFIYDSKLEPADPDFYKIGYVSSMRAYGIEFKEGPDGFGVYASKDVEPLRRPRMTVNYLSGQKNDMFMQRYGFSSSVMDKTVGNMFKMMNADDGKMVKEYEFKKLLTEILGSIILQLEGNKAGENHSTVLNLLKRL